MKSETLKSFTKFKIFLLLLLGILLVFSLSVIPTSGTNYIGSKAFMSFQIPQNDQYPYQDGWPITIGDQVQYSSAAIFDVNNDGTKEVFLAADDGYLYGWYSNGTLIAGWPAGPGAYGSPVIADINNDGKVEFLVSGGGKDNTEGSTDGILEAFYLNGSRVIGWPVKLGNFVTSTPAIADLDNDGTVEIIVGIFSGWPSDLSGEVTVLRPDGSVFPGWPQITMKPIHTTSPAVGDVDGDGDLEIFCGTDGGVYAWHHTGKKISGWPRKTDLTLESSLVVADINKDGQAEVIFGDWDGKVHILTMNGDDLPGWPKTTPDWGAGGPDHVFASPALADIDNDGFLEIFIGAGSYICGWHHNGTQVAGWPVYTGDDGAGIHSSAAIGDVDGDGELEIVCASKWDRKIFVWNVDGSVVPGWPKIIGYVVSSPAIGDLDNDGDLEIVIGTLEGFSVFVWDCPGSGPVPWPMFRGFPNRTGFLSFEYIPLPTTQSSQLIWVGFISSVFIVMVILILIKIRKSP